MDFFKKEVLYFNMYSAFMCVTTQHEIKISFQFLQIMIEVLRYVKVELRISVPWNEKLPFYVAGKKMLVRYYVFSWTIIPNSTLRELP